MTFGSMAGSAEAGLDAAVEAILRGGRRVVLQGAPGPASPSLLASGRSTTARSSAASLVVHHGGTGTTHAVVAAGPVVVVAHVGDETLSGPIACVGLAWHRHRCSLAG